MAVDLDVVSYGPLLFFGVPRQSILNFFPKVHIFCNSQLMSFYSIFYGEVSAHVTPFPYVHMSPKLIIVAHNGLFFSF